ncbi:MAG TPA: 3-phosphoshikimate 1-carboxyvinyltransferase [Candidatus Treponema faecavium]|nr:3-phosphoshikimate 1-carboxyvinyltransferase [Candidatus Treponema faecavium]
MKATVRKSSLSGRILVPGSKSHTIRACIFAAFADGVSHIRKPLASADCVSAARCIRSFGASVNMADDNSVWTVRSGRAALHLPDNVLDVGNSGSSLYFLSPIAALFSGWSVFTGDESIRSRPVSHVIDALRQLGAEAYASRPGCDAPPLLIRGPMRAGSLVTDGRLSQYISGVMMAAALMEGRTDITLTDPKEIPYLHMTRLWLESFGIPVEMDAACTHISVSGPRSFAAFDRTIPSDWEAVAFPLVGGVLTDSDIVIEDIDGSGSQGDDAIVAVLQELGADIEWDRGAAELRVRGGKKSRRGARLAVPVGAKEYRVNCSGFPDAVPILCVAACFTEGTVIIEDIGVCRRKETDRIAVMRCELQKLGADIEEGEDFIVIHGHSPYLADGSANPDFALHGGECACRGDHRVAMSLAVCGLAVGDVAVQGADCCAVSFPDFFAAMAGIGAVFE